MTGARISFGIVGCGHASRNHARALMQLPGVELVAACDTDAGTLDNFTRLYGGRGYLHYEEMLEKEKNMDVVIICTPSELHSTMGIMAAHRGKHVLVEKPMALSLESADRLINACAKEGVYLSVVLQNRFKPVLQLLKLAVDGGKFGRLSHGVATVRWNRNDDYYSQRPWRGSRDKGGGVLMNQAIHSVDALQWIMGGVDNVMAQMATRYRPIAAEDVGMAMLKFKSGALGLIEAASTIYPRNLEESIAVFGERGTVVIGDVNSGKIRAWDFFDFIGKNQAMYICAGAVEHNDAGHLAVLQDLINAMKKGCRPALDGHEGRKSLEVVLGIYRSAETGQPVSLPLASTEEHDAY